MMFGAKRAKTFFMDIVINDGRTESASRHGLAIFSRSVCFSACPGNPPRPASSFFALASGLSSCRPNPKGHAPHRRVGVQSVLAGIPKLHRDRKDHLLNRSEDAELAVSILTQLSAECAQAGSTLG